MKKKRNIPPKKRNTSKEKLRPFREVYQEYKKGKSTPQEADIRLGGMAECAGENRVVFIELPSHRSNATSVALRNAAPRLPGPLASPTT